LSRRRAEESSEPAPIEVESEESVSRWLEEPAEAVRVIEVLELTKKFGDVVADDAVSFTVRAGETFGLLGPNGAGKTTLIRMLTTLLSPTSGTAKIQGLDLRTQKPAVRAVIGTVSQAVTTDENLTVRENLSVQGKMYGLSGTTLAVRIEQRLREVGLWDRRHQLTKALSGGMRRRLEIARGVLHSPQVLFLDEPTTGLDPQSRRAIWEMFGELKALDPALCILLTTHSMDEADVLCDRLAIMDRGRILCEGSPEALKRALHTGERVELEIDGRLADADGEALCALGAVNLRTDSGRGIEFQARPEEGVGRRAAQLLEGRGYRIRHLTIAPVSLEDVFFSHTGRALRDA